MATIVPESLRRARLRRPMTYRLLLSCVTLAFVVACSKNVQVPKSPQSLSPRELQGATQAMAEAVRDVLRTQDEQLWAHWTEGKPLDLEAAYRGRESVYSADAVRTVRAARDRAVLRARSGDAEAAREVRALTHLLVHVTGEALARELRGPSDAVSALEASLTFGDGQREYPLGELDRLLTREKNAARRQAMYRNATPSFERLAE
ncbi:MAG TPA: hypothetical protein VEY30_05795, partial [Myxococcaceae bacterium]|nr:hypothetical protein [Myxococcaceae bacterium]